jgi:RHS repeat-associated protein
VQGSGFAVSSGTLACSYPSQSILVSNTGRSLLNGSYTADVKISSSGPVDMGLVFRYQNTSNYYWLAVTSSSMILKKRSGGSNSTLATYGSGATSGVFNRFRLDLSTSGSTLTIKVYYNGAYKFSATDNSPLAAGSVGMIGGYSTVSWDNAVATTNTTPGTVVSYDDLDAWGMVLEGRSGNSADGRQRYKFTGKERDTESKYDYFGARYYDAKIGRFLVSDPHAEIYSALSSYSYAGNNPLAFKDINGMDSTDASAKTATKRGDTQASKDENKEGGSKVDPTSPAIVGFETQNFVLEKAVEQAPKTQALGRATENFVKGSKLAGKTLALVSAGIALKEATQEGSTASYIEAGIKGIGVIGGPLSGATIAALDATGTIHQVSQDLGSHLDKQASDIKVTFVSGFSKFMNDIGYTGYVP